VVVFEFLVVDDESEISIIICFDLKNHFSLVSFNCSSSWLTFKLDFAVPEFEHKHLVNILCVFRSDANLYLLFATFAKSHKHDPIILHSAGHVLVGAILPWYRPCLVQVSDLPGRWIFCIHSVCVM